MQMDFLLYLSAEKKNVVNITGRSHYQRSKFNYSPFIPCAMKDKYKALFNCFVLLFGDTGKWLTGMISAKMLLNGAY